MAGYLDRQTLAEQLRQHMMDAKNPPKYAKTGAKAGERHCESSCENPPQLQIIKGGKRD